MRALGPVLVGGVGLLLSTSCGMPKNTAKSEELTVSPGAGTYPSGLVVTITAPSATAVVYYSTDGSEPDNTAQVLSPNFTGGSRTVTLLASTTVKTFFVDGGRRSSTLSVAYDITPDPSPPLTPDYPAGFVAGPYPQLNGDAVLNGNRLQLTGDIDLEAGSAFFAVPLNVQSFTTTFTFQLTHSGTEPMADGITFTVQNVGPFALGSVGGGLGYGPEPIQGSYNSKIDRSVAVKFDTFDDVGEGTNSIGVYTEGASPTVPMDSLPAGLDLHSGHVFAAQITYNGTNLSVTLTDQSVAAPSPTFTQTYPIDIPATIGSTTGYMGFTGSTGGNSSAQEILSWTFSG